MELMLPVLTFAVVVSLVPDWNDIVLTLIPMRELMFAVLIFAVVV